MFFFFKQKTAYGLGISDWSQTCALPILPALDRAMVRHDLAAGLGPLNPPPRILLLYGSLRARSFSRLAVEEAARLLILFGAEVRIFDPSDLPLPAQVEGDDPPDVHDMSEHALRSAAMGWCSQNRES